MSKQIVNLVAYTENAKQKDQSKVKCQLYSERYYTCLLTKPSISLSMCHFWRDQLIKCQNLYKVEKGVKRAKRPPRDLTPEANLTYDEYLKRYHSAKTN